MGILCVCVCNLNLRYLFFFLNLKPSQNASRLVLLCSYNSVEDRRSLFTWIDTSCHTTCIWQILLRYVCFFLLPSRSRVTRTRPRVSVLCNLSLSLCVHFTHSNLILKPKLIYVSIYLLFFAPKSLSLSLFHTLLLLLQWWEKRQVEINCVRSFKVWQSTTVQQWRLIRRDISYHKQCKSTTTIFF